MSGHKKIAGHNDRQSNLYSEYVIIVADVSF